MNWEVERDSSGRTIRLWWKGSGGKPKTRVLPSPEAKPPCPDCGFLFGWHKLGCSQNAKRSAAASDGCAEK